MTRYQPALLIKLINDEPAGAEIEGEAIIFITRDERGGREASGSFKRADKPFQAAQRLLDRLFQYEGSAFEQDNRYELRATMVVTSSRGELCELETNSEPVIVQKLDVSGKPIVFPGITEFDPSDNSN